MRNKKFEELGIEYILSIQGLSTIVYAPKREGLGIDCAKYFSDLKYLGNVETASLKSINNGLVVSENANDLCAILKKSRRFDKANAVLNLNINSNRHSIHRDEFILQFYQIDFENKLHKPSC
jgi:hypothetical protein